MMESNALRVGTATREHAEPTARTARHKRKWARPFLMWLAVAAIVIFCLFPFYWLINVSLKSGQDLSNANLVPPHPTLKNYQSIFKNSDFTDALRNSAIVTVVTTALALTVGSFAAYALASSSGSSSRSRRSRRSRSPRRCSSSGATSASTTPIPG
jgi:ABC-type sugar transport system permease subunit